MKKSNPKSAFLAFFVAASIVAFGPGLLEAIAGNISPYDWGDAPDPTYPTLAINNGASHVVAGPWLGDPTDIADPEPDGQPNPNARGDDADGNDDEDGVSIPPLIPGQPGDITLEVRGGGGIVQAWIDFDADGTWQASEQIYDDFLPDEIHIISFFVPDDAVVGQTFARFRISRQGGLGPEGPAPDGEVEDHRVSIGYGCQPLSGPTAAVQQFVRGDANQDYQVDEADAYFIMDYLLVGGPSPECMDAADTDDSGTVDIADATFILNYKFLGTAPPPPPFPDCGPDPTDDSLRCDRYELCPGSDVPFFPQDTKWIQLPDVTNLGIDIRVDSSDDNIRTIADDFECRSENLITDVHLWGSWKGDEKGIIKRIHLSIHADDPPGPDGPDTDNEFSKPAPDVLWSKDFLPGQFGEALYHRVRDPGQWWWDPVTGQLYSGADTGIWQIDIDIEPDEAFLQSGSPDDPVIYWLAVQVDTEQGEFGWKTRRWPDHYMDDAVWDVFFGLLPQVWRELRYPETHPYHSLEKNSIDMAFCLTYTPEVPEQPTSRPGSITHCPVVETRCPSVETRCPALKTRCPASATRCPAEETKCPALATRCPPVETECRRGLTVCPAVLTECPPTETECSTVAITECPPTETTCPALLTECPVYETRCPPEPTKCPMHETRCPSVMTKCPPTETECSTVAITECPPTETTCPALLTECPVYETRCPAESTKCPMYETRCPAESTKCPPVVTNCPVVKTRCPESSTNCPVVPTRCPATETECPRAVTKCPHIDTECPVAVTQCPFEETECDSVDTECPSVDTECPVAVTECPPVESRCDPVETECPPVETECPFDVTSCPYVATICSSPVACIQSPGSEHIPLGTKAAKSSPVRAQCPAIDVQCPSIVPEHLLAETRGPVAQDTVSKARL